MPEVKRGVIAGWAAFRLRGGGCLLVLEIVAGRLLAPTVGVSLYTWTSVIGVVLAGVSLGNYTLADASLIAGPPVSRSRSSTSRVPSRLWRFSFSFATSSRYSCCRAARRRSSRSSG